MNNLINDDCIKIMKTEDENVLWFDTNLDDECFCVLYDLIKDGLVVKEKKGECSNSN